jgi:ribonuclease T1
VKLSRPRGFDIAIAILVAIMAWPLSTWPRESEGQEARAVAVVSLSALPAEARQTVSLIRQGGPFPYERDGAAFRNFERLLPQHDRSYYREYTVRTPGIAHRGARRIVVGRGGELYYTDDHYASFKRVRE